MVVWKQLFKKNKKGKVGIGLREADFAARLREAGGRVFLVGGWVRDKCRGAVPHDKDYMVAGLAAGQMEALFPGIKRVGHGFPVYLVPIDGEESEVALARKERKQGAGYRGFAIECDPTVTVEEDLYRRDTTMNSMAFELPMGRLIDPYGGRADIEQRLIRAVSHHFLEDPVRALRAARQAAEFGFTIEPQTLAYMRACREELAAEPAERIVAELRRALKAPWPSRFFRSLAAAGLLASIFPEIHALIGKTQPVAFHPEGDAFNHTMLIVDAVARQTPSILARFSALVHDLGKGTTPREMEPHHYGHEERGLDCLRAWDARTTLPRIWLKAGAFVIAEHMRAPRLTKPGKIARLLLDVDRSALSLAEFNAIIQADHHSLPDYLLNGSRYLAAMKAIHGDTAPAGLQGPAVRDWLFGEQVRALCTAMQAKD